MKLLITNKKAYCHAMNLKDESEKSLFCTDLYKMFQNIVNTSTNFSLSWMSATSFHISNQFMLNEIQGS